jgi:hypothetical protein
MAVEPHTDARAKSPEGEPVVAPPPERKTTPGSPRRGKKRSRIWLALWFGVMLLVFGGVLGALVFRELEKLRISRETTELQSTPNVIVAIRDLARLEGTEFRIERVISLKDKQSRFFGLIRPEDAILLVASGTVTAGVDLSRLAEGDVEVDQERRSVNIVLPSSTVFSARLDNQRTFVFKRDTDVLAERADSLETRARQEAERTLATAAEEGRILEHSNDSVRRTVETLIRSLGYRIVNVSFRGAPGSGEQK